jgi:hypothetical protein
LNATTLCVPSRLAKCPCPPAVPEEHPSGSYAADDEIVGPAEDEAVCARAERAHGAFELAQGAHGCDDVVEPPAHVLFRLELALRQPVEQERRGDTQGKRDRDREDLAVERVQDGALGRSAGQAGRELERADRPFGEEVGRHAEQRAEHGALDGDLGGLREATRAGNRARRRRVSGVAAGRLPVRRRQSSHGRRTAPVQPRTGTSHA